MNYRESAKNCLPISVWHVRIQLNQSFLMIGLGDLLVTFRTSARKFALLECHIKAFEGLCNQILVEIVSCASYVRA